MTTKFELDLKSLPDLHWHELGQSTLKGELFKLFYELDRLFLSWASNFGASEYLFPPFLSSLQMAKLDYFKSFPHLITIPVVLSGEKSNLEAFAGQDNAKEIRLTDLAEIRQVMTPAACYHFYDELEGVELEQKTFLTTRCVCYRREENYAPLTRQWAFSMREIVCLAGMAEVKAFLEEFEQLLLRYFEKLQLPVKFEYATDPFFNPLSNPKYLMQKLEPVKREMVYDGWLSVGSLNFHRNFFGETFSISCNQEPAFSACVAFGLERWIYMILREQGYAPEGWHMQ